jgi:anti-anti-sigma factor
MKYAKVTERAMDLHDGLLGDTPMLVVAGTIDQSSAGDLRAGLDKWSKARHNIVFLDLGDVDGVDSAGLTVLTDWVRSLGGKGWLGVVAPSPDVRRVLEAGGLLPHPNVRLFETRQAGRIATQERQST